MKKTIKTESVLAAFRVINTAKYNKMTDEDKIKVWKIARALKPVANKFDDDSKDAAEKLKPCDDYDEKLAQAQEYERVSRDKNADASQLKMGAAEYNEFIKTVNKYRDLISKALKEDLDREVEVEFEPISEEAMLKLMNSNDWTMAETMAVGDIVME